MKYKTILFVMLLIGIVVVAGCAKSSTGYANYNPQQGQDGQQQPFVGGGCGVSPIDNVGNSPAVASSVLTSNL